MKYSEASAFWPVFSEVLNRQIRQLPKDGVDLRLFHASPRHSEDMDFDVTVERGAQFVNHLRKVLAANTPFRAALLRRGLKILRSVATARERYKT
jgi:hypothetical protein